MNDVLPVQNALDFIDRTLADELSIHRIDDRSRTKVHLFEFPARGGLQFAIRVGDPDPATGRFPLASTRAYLERPIEGQLDDVQPCPDQVNNGSRLQQKDSRLAPGKQFPVEVTSTVGLRRLLEWYADIQPKKSSQPSESAFAEANDPVHSRNETMTATNTILYGPPGTGKTYRTFRRAVELCDGPVPAGTDESAVRRRYDELRALGRISFVTFHPSYGYEEFVEGLRPQASEQGDITYGVRPGAFKRACEAAESQGLELPTGATTASARGRTVYKFSLGSTENDEAKVIFDYCLKNDCVLMGWGERVDYTGCSDATAIAQRLAERMPEAERPASQVSFIDRFKNDMKVGDLVVASLGNSLYRGIAEVTGEYVFAEDAPFNHLRAVRWLAVFEAGRPVDEIYARSFTQVTLYRLDPGAIRYDAMEALIQGDAKPAAALSQPHVLVIDEINRANISKVFGELITLIEPDKRKGAHNAVTVRLPYSGEDFSVPDNLHLLGTMNTADRSIALLDTALRRRFEFIEVMPEPEVLRGQEVEGVVLARLLASLNERIEALYDRDHMVGHAYLLGVTSLQDLDRTFRTKLLPLLMEYFYENASKVRRVLNDTGAGDFVERVIRAPVPPDEEGDTDDEPTVVHRVNPRPFPVGAYKRIYADA
jgi:5-methylcytosine-specific restriction protein B